MALFKHVVGLAGREAGMEDWFTKLDRLVLLYTATASSGIRSSNDGEFQRLRPFFATMMTPLYESL